MQDGIDNADDVAFVLEQAAINAYHADACDYASRRVAQQLDALAELATVAVSLARIASVVGAFVAEMASAVVEGEEFTAARFYYVPIREAFTAFHGGRDPEGFDVCQCATCEALWAAGELCAWIAGATYEVVDAGNFKRLADELDDSGREWRRGQAQHAYLHECIDHALGWDVQNYHRDLDAVHYPVPRMAA